MEAHKLRHKVKNLGEEGSQLKTKKKPRTESLAMQT